VVKTLGSPLKIQTIHKFTKFKTVSLRLLGPGEVVGQKTDSKNLMILSLEGLTQEWVFHFYLQYKEMKLTYSLRRKYSARKAR
jgi:hypothetical protein